jgi:hypothetical protein
LGEGAGAQEFIRIGGRLKKLALRNPFPRATVTLVADDGSGQRMLIAANVVYAAFVVLLIQLWLSTPETETRSTFITRI